MPTEFTSYLFTQGVLGVALFAVLGVFGVYYRNSQKKLDAKDAKILELMELRRVDAVETRTEVTSILPGMSQALSGINEKIEIIKEQGRK